MRARRRDRQLLFAAIVVIVSVWMLATADRTEAAPRTETSCWWDGSTLRAEDLPTTRLFGFTVDGYPHGVWLSTDDGTFERPGLSPMPAIFYTRGGGGALFKFGAQLQDYHPIATCAP